MDETTAAESSSPSRRTILGGAAVLGAGAVLAACGGSGESVVSGGTSTTGRSASSSGAGTDVGKTSSVPVGGGIYSDEAKAFISQPTAGTYKAFDAICTHKQCPMTKIEGSTISCQCHGSQFSALDGSVKHGPATSALTAVKVVEKDGELYVQG